MNLLPRQGAPTRRLETLTQAAVRALAWLPVYTAVIATLTLVVILLGWL